MKHYLKFGFGVIAGCLLAAGMAAGIFTATAQTTNLTPVATVTGSITSTAALQVIGSNPGRKSIQALQMLAPRLCGFGPAHRRPPPVPMRAAGHWRPGHHDLPLLRQQAPMARPAAQSAIPGTPRVPVPAVS